MINLKNKIEPEIHADPLNLNFYLIKDGFDVLTFDLIKKKNIISIFGDIELAIIGSSHYLKLENHFTEIMTCSPEELSKDSLLLISVKRKNKFTRVLNFDSFKYTFSVETMDFDNERVFTAYEQSLMQDKKVFAHTFYENSAITALKHKEKDDSFMFESWHTYPQQNKIIYSKTVLLAR